MRLEAILEALRETFPTEEVEAQPVPIDETFVTLPPDCIHQAVRLLVERFDLRHLSVITSLDTGSEIELLYHFWDGRGLTLRTSLPRQEPRITSLTDLIPGADFYEREVAEMLGLDFDGLPDPRPLLLPDDWDGEPPLRRRSSPTPPASTEAATDGGKQRASEGQEVDI